MMQALAAVQDQLYGTVDYASVARLLDQDDFVGQFLAVDVDSHTTSRSRLPRMCGWPLCGGAYQSRFACTSRTHASRSRYALRSSSNHASATMHAIARTHSTPTARYSNRSFMIASSIFPSWRAEAQERDVYLRLQRRSAFARLVRRN